MQANKEQLALINEIKGKKMSRLEFYETVFPDLASKFTDSQKERYARIPFRQKSSKLMNVIDIHTDNDVQIGQEDNRTIDYMGRMLENMPVFPKIPVTMGIDIYVDDKSDNDKAVAYASTNEDNTFSARVEDKFYEPIRGHRYVDAGYFYLTYEDQTSVSTATTGVLTSK